MRIVYVTSRYPWPARRGNQVRAAEWLEALRGHELALVTPAPPTGAAAPPVPVELHPYRGGRPGPGAALRWLRGLPAQEALFATASARRALRSALARPADLVVVQMVRCAWAAAVALRAAPGVPLLFDAIDSMSLHYRRAAELAPAPLRPAFRSEAGRCARRERALATAAALVTAVARRDLEAVAADPERTAVVPVAAGTHGGAGSPGAPVLLLSGNLGYRPTVRGALRFARAVWPRLAARRPGLRWILAGARPPRAVRRLAALPGVEVHPEPPTLEPFFASAGVAIAPMAEGSGTPMKVLEAWAHGLPVVAHPWAAAGLGVRDGEGMLLAEEADAWVAAVERLLDEPGLAAELGEAGRRRVARRHSPAAVARAVREAVDRAARARAARGPA